MGRWKLSSAFCYTSAFVLDCSCIWPLKWLFRSSIKSFRIDLTWLLLLMMIFGNFYSVPATVISMKSQTYIWIKGWRYCRSGRSHKNQARLIFGQPLLSEVCQLEWILTSTTSLRALSSWFWGGSLQSRLPVGAWRAVARDDQHQLVVWVSSGGNRNIVNLFMHCIYDCLKDLNTWSVGVGRRHHGSNAGVNRETPVGYFHTVHRTTVPSAQNGFTVVWNQGVLPGPQSVFRGFVACAVSAVSKSLYPLSQSPRPAK